MDNIYTSDTCKLQCVDNDKTMIAEVLNFKLAERVDELEKENSDLKQKLSAHDDDLK